MKQTAVEQAIKEIADLWSSPSDTPTYTQIFNVLENKLEMEKQQIELTAIKCHFEGVREIAKTREEYIDYGKNHYNQTFNK